MKQRIYALDFFRIFICLAVFAFHLVCHGVFHISGKSFLGSNLITGAVYMDAFYILSGFLLQYLYGRQDLSKKEDLKKFYYKRLLRIYPLYAGMTLLTSVLVKGAFKGVTIPIEILCLQAFFPPLFSFSGNGGTWFISALLFCYLMFPAISKILQMIDNKKLFLFLIYFVIVYSNIIAALFSVNLYTSPVYRILAFAVGMILCDFFTEHKCARCKINLFLSGGGWLCLLSVLFVSVGILYKNDFVKDIGFSANYTYYSIVTIPLFSMMIYFLVFFKNDTIEKIGSSRIVQHFSALTFPFFLFQGFAIKFTKKLSALYLFGRFEKLICVLAVSLILSELASFIFEKKCASLIKKYLLKKRKTLPQR